MIRVQVLPLYPPAFCPSATKGVNDFVLLRDDGSEIDTHILRVYAPSRGVPRIVGHLSSMNHGFCRRTSCVDARATEVPFFDQRNSPSEIREAKRQGNASLSRANHNRIVFHINTYFMFSGISQECGDARGTFTPENTN